MARPRHTERIVYVVGGQLEATVPHEPLHHIPDLQALGNMKLLLPRTDMAPNGAELLQRDELSTEERVWDHQRPLRSVFRFFGRGETLGDVGSLGVMDVCEYDFGRECCHAVH